MKSLWLLIAVCMAIASRSFLSLAQPVTWTQVNSAISPFASAGSGVLGDYYYCFGGDQAGPIAQAFNLSTEQWSVSTAAPLGWNRFGSVSTSDAIYLVGWCTVWQTFGNAVQKFTPTAGGPAGIWTQMAGYPITAVGMAVAWDNGNFIYAAGGIDNNSNVYASAYKYDIAANSWTPIANMPYQMVWSGAAFCAGRLYVVGGTNMPQTLLEYNPVTNTWSEKTGPTSPIYNGNGTTCSDGLVYSISGGGVSFPQSSAVQIYDPRANSWAQETPLPLTLGANSARFIPPDKVISAGGYMNGQYLTTTFRGTGFPYVHGEGGETCETAVDIPGIPFVGEGNTSNNFDNYNPPFAVPGGRDIVYRYAPTADQNVDISLCSAAYDSRLEVYATQCSGVPYRCNDDGCSGPNYPYSFVSLLMDVELLAGQTYYIVVDGYNGSEHGAYILDIAARETPWVADDNCPVGTMFGQPHYNESIAIFSDSVYDQRLYDNFSGLTQPICGIEFWGYTGYWDGSGFHNCDMDSIAFEIGFFVENGGLPVVEEASYRVTLYPQATTGNYLWPIWKFTAALDPCLTLQEGWLSVRAIRVDNPPCKFAWNLSPIGDCVDWGKASDDSWYRQYTDYSFCLMPSFAADPMPGAILAQFALYQNYPNPFNPTTTIAYDAPIAGHISLRVFDLLGREVAVLNDGIVAAGTHLDTFDGSGLTSGIYFVRLDAGKFSQTKKLVLMK